MDLDLCPTHSTLQIQILISAQWGCHILWCKTKWPQFHWLMLLRYHSQTWHHPGRAYHCLFATVFLKSWPPEWTWPWTEQHRAWGRKSVLPTETQVPLPLEAVGSWIIFRKARVFFSQISNIQTPLSHQISLLSTLGWHNKAMCLSSPSLSWMTIFIYLKNVDQLWEVYCSKGPSLFYGFLKAWPVVWPAKRMAGIPLSFQNNPRSPWAQEWVNLFRSLSVIGANSCLWVQGDKTFGILKDRFWNIRSTYITNKYKQQ